MEAVSNQATIRSPGATFNGSRRRVVVIEDNPFWQYQLRQHLKAIDVRIDVQMHATAEQFLSQSDGLNTIDLVIADYFLGEGQSGLSVWRELQHRDLDIPFALTSGLDESDFAALTATDKKRPAFIGKALVLHDFRLQIEKMLGLQEPLETAVENKKLESHFWVEFALSIAVIALVCSFVSHQNVDNQPQVTRNIPTEVISAPQIQAAQLPNARLAKRLPKSLFKQMDRILATADEINESVQEQ